MTSNDNSLNGTATVQAMDSQAGDATPSLPVGTLKNSFLDKSDTGIVESEIRDDSMLYLTVDLTKHQASLNKHRTETTLVKTGLIKLDNGDKLSLIYKQVSPEAREKQFKKDLKRKISLAIKGTATAEDLRWLIRNGFASDVPGREGTIDAGKVEATDADFKAEASRNRARAIAAKNNGSLQARLNATLGVRS